MAYRVDEASLTAVADAIREKSGTSEGLTFPEGFVNAVTGIQAGGGGENILDSVVDRTITEINSNAERVADYAFYDDGANSNIKKVNLPNATRIGGHAFEVNTKLTTVNAPKATIFGAYAFSKCSLLEEVNAPLLKTIDQNCFYNNQGAMQIVDIDFPLVTSIGSNSFYGCSYLKNVNLPLITTVSANAFYGCKELEFIDLPLVISILRSAFSGCSKLACIVLKTNALCSLANTNAFSNTPFASGGTGGTVYVPEALIESYKTATNWSTLYNAGTCNFVAIEGSEYDTTT